MARILIQFGGNLHTGYNKHLIPCKNSDETPQLTAMGKAAKSTKKFQNKHLKHTLEQRRAVKEQSKKYELRRGKSKSSGPQPTKEKRVARETFSDMSVDQFFEGGFELPKPKKGTNVAVNGDSDESESELENDSEEEDAEQNGEKAESSEEEDEQLMEKNMANLKDKDPEFLKYLKENDKNLLDFEAVNPLDAMSDDEDESALEDEQRNKSNDRQIDVTAELVQKWEKQLKTAPTNKLIQNVATAFNTIVHCSRSDAETNAKYTLNDPSVLTSIMMVGLKSLPTAIGVIAPCKTDKNNVTMIGDDSKEVRKLSRILKLQASAYLSLLNESTTTESAALILSSLQEMLPYYLSQKKFLKLIMTAVVQLWATASKVETQVAAYAFLNNAAKEYSKSALEIILRSSYSAILKNCRNTTVHNIETINFAKNSAADLFGIDEQLSYAIGFEYVRQLAIHLRNSLNSNISSTSAGKDAYKKVYNWQFCHSLDFWSRVLSKLCNPEKELLDHKSHESPLRSLIYPLVQVTLGSIRLIPTAQFFPLRFYLVRSLIRLSLGTQVFIPIFPLLAEMLTSTAISKPGKSANLQAIDFDYHIKVSLQYLGTRVYQDGLTEQFIELVSEFFVLYAKNIAFPELATPAILSLRRFVKKSKNIRLNKQIQQIVEKLNENASYISTQRANVGYGPTNKTEALNFLKDEKWESTPLGQFVAVQRKTREHRRTLLKEALQDEANNKKTDDM